MKPDKTYTFTSSDVRRGYNSYHEEDELYVLVEDADEVEAGGAWLTEDEVCELMGLHTKATLDYTLWPELSRRLRTIFGDTP